MIKNGSPSVVETVTYGPYRQWVCRTCDWEYHDYLDGPRMKGESMWHEKVQAHERSHSNGVKTTNRVSRRYRLTQQFQQPRVITIHRPGEEMEVGEHVLYDGKVYTVEGIEELDEDRLDCDWYVLPSHMVVWSE